MSTFQLRHFDSNMFSAFVSLIKNNSSKEKDMIQSLSPYKKYNLKQRMLYWLVSTSLGSCLGLSGVTPPGPLPYNRVVYALSSSGNQSFGIGFTTPTKRTTNSKMSLLLYFMIYSTYINKKHLWCKYMYSAWDVMANTFKFLWISPLQKSFFGTFSYFVVRSGPFTNLLATNAKGNLNSDWYVAKLNNLKKN